MLSIIQFFSGFFVDFFKNYAKNIGPNPYIVAKSGRMGRDIKILLNALES